MNHVTTSKRLSSQALPHRYPDHRNSSIGENPYGATIKLNISPPTFFVSVLFTCLRERNTSAKKRFKIHLGLRSASPSARSVNPTYVHLHRPTLFSISSPQQNSLYTREHLNAVAIDDRLGCDKSYVRKVDSPCMRIRGTSSIELVPLAEYICFPSPQLIPHHNINHYCYHYIATILRIE